MSNTWLLGLAIAFALPIPAAHAHGDQTNGHRHDQPDGNDGQHELIVAPEFIPGSPHGHYRQKLPYGQGYRYGHGVNGPMGDIIIMSPAPVRGYGSNTPARLQPRAPITPPRHRHPRDNH